MFEGVRMIFEGLWIALYEKTKLESEKEETHWRGQCYIHVSDISGHISGADCLPDKSSNPLFWFDLARLVCLSLAGCLPFCPLFCPCFSPI